MMEGSFLLPGDVVGSAEEFVPGDCTYAKGGVIYASTAGLVMIDSKTRSANVIPKTNARQSYVMATSLLARSSISRTAWS